MKKVAIIPLRKGSKGIPGKNKKKLLGRPLFSWVVGAAIFSELDEVYVFTDDEEILTFISKEYHWTSKVKGLLRNDENANDTASTSAASAFVTPRASTYEPFAQISAVNLIACAVAIRSLTPRAMRLSAASLICSRVDSANRFCGTPQMMRY